jgi:hypothetical protein
MELQSGGDVSTSETAADSTPLVIRSGSTSRVVNAATLGAGTSMLEEVTAGEWMQQVGLTAGAVFGGQQS